MGRGEDAKDSETPLQLQERAEIEQKVKAWAQGAASGPREDSAPAPDCLTFPASLSGFGRKVVHETAAALVLPCFSLALAHCTVLLGALSCLHAFAQCAPMPGLAVRAASAGRLRHAMPRSRRAQNPCRPRLIDQGGENGRGSSTNRLARGPTGTSRCVCPASRPGRRKSKMAEGRNATIAATGKMGARVMEPLVAHHRRCPRRTRPLRMRGGLRRAVCWSTACRSAAARQLKAVRARLMRLACVGKSWQVCLSLEPKRARASARTRARARARARASA